MINSRIALLFAGLVVAAGSSAAPATMRSKDPDSAPVAAVDRFSKEAGHLQLRTAAGDIPGPNVPVDFDRAPFITQGLSAEGKVVRYYNFDVQSTTPAPLYVLYRMGEDHPVKGQLDIVDNLPGEKGYSDFRQLWKVAVPHDYQPNAVTDAADIRKAGYRTERTEILRNMPLVPDNSVARIRLKGESPALQRAWYRGKIVKYFSFNEVSLSAAGSGAVPVSPIYVTFNVNPEQPNGGPGSGFRTEPGSEQTHNVPSTLPGNPAYSPLWLVNIYDNANWSMVHDLDTASKAKILGPGVAAVNCPIVFIAP